MVSLKVCSRALRMLMVATVLALSVPMSVPPVLGVEAAVSTVWVDAVAGNNANPGTQGQPFKTITHALSVTGSSDTVMIKPGTYNAASGEVFPLVPNGQSMVGVMGAPVTTISGGGTQRILIGQDYGQGDRIEGLTFADGAVGAGAALTIYLDDPTGPDSPRIADNVFRDNDSDFGGGAVALFTGAPVDARPLVEGNVFEGNSASQEGGAIRASGYVGLTVRGNRFEGNTSPFGGAVFLGTQSATATIEGNEFVGNSAGNTGGAVHMSYSGGETHTISGNTFENNEAVVAGGALWLYGAVADVFDNRAKGNSVGSVGGFGYLEFTHVEAHNNLIVNHEAGSDAPAWYLESAALYERNDTVAGSLAGPDSATYATATSHLDIANSIYWNSELLSDIVGADALSYSCVADVLVDDPSRSNSVGAGVIFDDPWFIGSSAWDLRLGLVSPCIDTGSNALAPATDFFGNARPVDGDGNGSAIADMGYFERPALELAALSGADRFQTAVDIATATFESAEVAVIASGMDFPDALSAAGLAGSYDAPLFLTRAGALPTAVSDALADLGVTKVFVIGGTAVVSPAVYNALDVDYEVERIFGADRYATAVEVAEAIAANEGAGFGKHAFVARGDSFPDALSVSPLACFTASPILLTRTGSLPASTAQALTDLDIESAVIAGGTGAVGAATKSAVDAKLVANGGSASERWFGADRYSTAADIAIRGVAAGYANWDSVGIATGENYPDALAGGVRTGHSGGIVLLTRTNSLSVPTRDLLVARATVILYVDVYGGVGAVAPAVRTAIEGALTW